nr:DUF3710 domain-containing protein [Devriesea agamarum]
MGLFKRRSTSEDQTQIDSTNQESGIDETVEAHDDHTHDQARAVDGNTTDGDNEYLCGGPWDEQDAPERDRLDLGGIHIPMIPGMELRMEVDQASGTVTAANVLIEGSSLQIQAFAAPRSRGLWDEVRPALRESVVDQGGTAEASTGPFGAELLARLPVRRGDGRTGYRPARFVGIDGPRWFVRAIISGAAVGHPDQARNIERVLSDVVVVRGREAMAPQELIPLHLPGQRPGLTPTNTPGLEPLERGPEITEIG